MATPLKLKVPSGPLLPWVIANPGAAAMIVELHNRLIESLQAAERREIKRPSTYTATAGASYDQTTQQELMDHVTGLTESLQATEATLVEVLATLTK